MPLIIGLAVIIFIIFQSDVSKLREILLTTDLRFFSLAALFYLSINLIQAYRIKLIIQSQGYENIPILKVFWDHMAGTLLAEATPGRTGYLSTAYFLKEDMDVRLSHGLHAIPYIYSVDFVIKAVATSLAILYLSLTLSIPIETVRGLIIVVAFGLFIAVLLTLVLFGIRPKPLESFLGRWTFGKKISETLHIFRQSTHASRRILYLIIGLSLCSWFLWGFSFYALGLSLGLYLPFLTFLFMQPIASLLSVVPITIGGLGFIEAGLTGIIILYGVSFERALAFALLSRMSELIVYLPTGAKTLFLRRKPTSFPQNVRSKRICSNKHQMKSRLQASVVLPTFNERENIEKLIKTIEALFESHKINGEIIVVDDNSPDGTAIIAQKLAEEYGNIKVIHRPQPMGVGSAVKDGIKHATKDTIILMDCDFSHPPSLIPQLLKQTKYADIVIASRYASGGGMIAPRIRVLASRIVNFFVKVVVNIPVSDVTGGYHAIKRYLFDTIDFTTPDGDYDIELLGKARKAGFKMIDYPYLYQFRESGVSKTFNIKYVLRYFLTALKVRAGLL